MIDSLRKHTQSLLVKILLFLLIASFALWGIGDMLQPAVTGGSVATVAGKEIPVQKVFNDYRRELNRMRELTQGQPIEPALSMAIGSTVLEREINRTLLQVAAEDMDIAISDELVASSIRSNEMFQENGSFSRPRFEQIMFSNQLTENEFIELVRGDIERDQLISIIDAGVSIPDFAAKALYTHRLEERTVSLLEIKVSDIKEFEAPTEAEIREFYNENTQNFLAPEYRTISLLHVTPKDLAETIDIAETDLEDAYSARMQEFTTQARRTVEQQVFATREEALAALEGYRDGAAFEGISLGSMSMADLPEGMAEAVFALEADQLSDPIESELGWHIVKVTEIIEGKTKSFEEVRAQLRETLALDKSTEALFEVSNDIEDSLAGGATMEEAAQSAGFRVNVIESVDENGFDKTGQPVASLVAKEAILTEAFTIDMTSEPQMRDDGAGGYFMVRVDSIFEASPRPFESVADVIRDGLISERKTAKAELRAKEMLEAANAGKPLSEIASDRGLSLSEERSFTRFNANLSQPLVTAIFNADKGETVSAASAEGHALATVIDISLSEESGTNIAVDALREELLNGLVSDVQGQFVNALRTRYSVSVDQGLLDAMIAQENQ